MNVCDLELDVGSVAAEDKVRHSLEKSTVDGQHPVQGDLVLILSLKFLFEHPGT